MLLTTCTYNVRDICNLFTGTAVNVQSNPVITTSVYATPPV